MVLSSSWGNPANAAMEARSADVEPSVGMGYEVGAGGGPPTGAGDAGDTVAAGRSCALLRPPPKRGGRMTNPASAASPAEAIVGGEGVPSRVKSSRVAVKLATAASSPCAARTTSKPRMVAAACHAKGRRSATSNHARYKAGSSAATMGRAW